MRPIVDLLILKRREQRHCHSIKTIKGLRKFWCLIAVDEGNQVLGVLGLDSRVGTGLPECARQHWKRGCGEIRELATKFIWIAGDQFWERFGGSCDDVRITAVDTMNVIDMPYQG